MDNTNPPDKTDAFLEEVREFLGEEEPEDKYSESVFQEPGGTDPVQVMERDGYIVVMVVGMKLIGNSGVETRILMDNTGPVGSIMREVRAAVNRYFETHPDEDREHS